LQRQQNCSLLVRSRRYVIAQPPLALRTSRVVLAFRCDTDLPKTCSGYQSAFVLFLVCIRSSRARLCSFLSLPSSLTTSQLRPLTLIQRQVTQSSRGLARNSLRESLFSSYCSIRSAEKSTAVI